MTTAGLVKFITRQADICDDCSVVAYDEGIKDWDAQVAFMVDAGDVAYDHVCNAKEDPSAGIQCDCGCRSR